VSAPAIVPPASRNDPCPCGSGQRYKHCHGAAGADAPAAPPQPPAAGAAAEMPVDPPDVAALRAVAQTALAGGLAAAEADWQRVLARMPGDAEAHFHLGNAARERDAHDEAIVHFVAALKSAPGNYGLNNNLGLAYKNAGRLRDAEDAFRRELTVNPDGFEPLANLAQNLYQQQRYEDALAYFEPLVRRYPDIPQDRLLRELVREQIGVMANDLIVSTRRNIAEARIETADDARDAGKALVCFSPELAAQERDLKRFMYAALYHHPSQLAAADRARIIVRDLFRAYQQQPDLMPREWQDGRLLDEPHRSRHIGDFIAGMTDRYAEKRHAEIFGELALS